MTSKIPGLVLAAVAAAVPATAQPSADPRSELAAFAAALDRAVARVSRPAASFLPASPGSRGYHLKGYGAVFVMASRALPAARQRAREAEAARALDQAARRLEQALERVDSNELRRRMQDSLKVLRETEAELKRTRAPELAPLLEAPPVEDLGLELEIVAEAEALRNHAQLAQSEVDRSLAEIEQRVRAHLAPPLPPAPPPPTPPIPPSAPVPTAPSPERPEAPEPPWSFWFEHEPADGRSPERVIHDVGEAVREVLEAHGPRLRVVRPEEAVVVAVDFTGRSRTFGAGFRDEGARARSERTLVVRVRKRELEARQQGKLGLEELLKRIEFVEY